MRKKFSIYIILAFFLLNTSYFISQSMTSTEKLLNKSNKNIISLDLKSPQTSLSEDWYRKYGLTKYNETINEMDTYNKTSDVYLIGYNYTGRDTGYTTDKDILLVKYNKTGVQEWNRTFNGGFDGPNYGNDIVVDQKSGNVYIVATIYNGSYSLNAIFIAKYNEEGEQMFNITWGYKNGYVTGNAIALNNTDLYVTGEKGGNIALVKFKINPSSFSYVWNVTWDSGVYTSGQDIDLTCGKYGNIYITSMDVSQFLSPDMLLICYNASGFQRWNITWHVDNVDIYGESVAVDSKDNIYVTGVAQDQFYNSYMFLRKYTNQSTFIWQKTWSGPYESAQGWDINIDSKDNILVAVDSAGTSIDSKLRIFEYTPSGILTAKIEWRSSNLGDGFLSTCCVSEFNNTSNIYIAGRFINSPTEYTEDYDIIIVKSPAMENITEGSNGDVVGDNDDDDNGNNKPNVIFSYSLFIVIGIIYLYSILKIKRILEKF